MLVKFFLCTLTIFVAVAGPTLGASRFRRQAQTVTAPANLTEILSALNLTTYLESATPQIQQAIANLTLAIQNQTTNFEQALQNVSSLQGQNLTQGLQAFFTNLQSQLTNQSTLSQAVTTLQNFYNTSGAGAGAALQNLVNTFGSGSNLTIAASNLQNQLNNLTQFFQTGLNQMYNSSTPVVQQSIQNLTMALNNGTLNQALTSLIMNFQGQSQTFQTLLNNLQLQMGSNNTTTTNPLQSTITTVQTGFQTYLNNLQTQFQNLLNTFGGFFSPTTTTTTTVAPTIIVG